VNLPASNKNNSVLTGFQLTTDYSQKTVTYSYKVNYCKLGLLLPQTALKLSTPANDWGSGSIYFLDRHDVKCGAGSALLGFHLFRPSDNQIQYQFDCITSQSISSRTTLQSSTPFNSTGTDDKNSANFLDRHNVQCPANMALQEFKLNRNPNNGGEIQYLYTCVGIIFSQCGTFSTFISQTFDGFSTIFLDRQYVSLPSSNSVITGFKLNTDYSQSPNVYSYSVSWCQLSDKATQVNFLNSQISTLTNNINIIYPAQLKTLDDQLSTMAQNLNALQSKSKSDSQKLSDLTTNAKNGENVASTQDQKTLQNNINVVYPPQINLLYSNISAVDKIKLETKNSLNSDSAKLDNFSKLLKFINTAF
jgi:hypothetical protein